MTPSLVGDPKQTDNGPFALLTSLDDKIDGTMQQDVVERTGVSKTVVPVTERKNGQRPKESEHGFRQLMHDLHDFGVLAMADRYRLFGRFLAYHDWDFHDPHAERPLLGDGHVLNVVRVVDLVEDVLRWANATGAEIPRFINLHGLADQFFSSQRHLREKPADELTPDERDNLEALSAWEQMDDKEQALITGRIAERAAEAHDLANLIKNVNDWNALKDPSRKTTDPVNPEDPNSPPIVEYYDRMQYDRVEEIEAQMFKQSLDAFRDELGWTPQQVAVAKALGAEWIRKTAFLPQHLPEGLAGFDQTASMFNPRAPWAIGGLLNEYSVRVHAGDQLTVSDFDPQAFFGGFIPWRFELLDHAYGREPGTTMREYLQFLDAFRRNSPENAETFCRILGVPDEQKEGVKRMDDLHTFVTERFAMQQEIARIFWPGEGRVRFDQAFEGWAEETFRRLETVCLLFQGNFWNPEYSVRQFQHQIASIAPDRR